MQDALRKFNIWWFTKFTGTHFSSVSILLWAQKAILPASRYNTDYYKLNFNTANARISALLQTSATR